VIRAAFTACLVLWTPLAAVAASVEVNVTDTKGRPVVDAVVSLVPLDAPARVTPPAQPLEIVQHGQEFEPSITALVVGTAVSFPNRDTVQHHVYSLSPPKKFELPLYAGEAKAPVVFDRPGVVALGCNIHDWMSAYVVVFTTPWFAKTGADGRATVADVPPGRYRAEVWHARLAATETREFTAAAAPATPLAFTLKLKAEHRIRRHPVTVPGSYH
jgi:plastocyanin